MVNYGELAKQHNYSAERPPTTSQTEPESESESETEPTEKQKQWDKFIEAYPNGPHEFFRDLWNNPSGSLEGSRREPDGAYYTLELFGPTCGVGLEGEARGAGTPEPDASPQDIIDGLADGTLSPRHVDPERVAAAKREWPSYEWLQGWWKPIVKQHGADALPLAEKVREIEKRRNDNPIRQAIITEDVGEAPSVDWLVDDVFIAGELVAVIGRKSAGKSTITSVDLACSVATGSPWLGRKVKQGKVLVVVAEGSSVEYQLRVRAWRDVHPDAGNPWDNLVPVVRRMSLVAKPETVVIADEEGERSYGRPPSVATADVRNLVQCIEEEQPTLVIVDNMAACMDGHSELSPSDISSVLAAMHEMNEAAGSTVLMIHHTDFSDRKPRGMTHFEDRMSSIAHVQKYGGSNDRVVKCYKEPRLAEPWEPIKLRMTVRGEAAVFVSATETDVDGIHKAMRDLAKPSSKTAILAKAKESGSGMNKSSGLRLIDELADDPDDPVTKDGAKYLLDD